MALEGQRGAGHGIFREAARVYWCAGKGGESCQMHALRFSFKTEELPEIFSVVFFFSFFPLQIARQQQGLARGLSCWDTSGQAGRKAGERPINHSFFPGQRLHAHPAGPRLGAAPRRKSWVPSCREVLYTKLQVTHRALSWDWTIAERLETAGKTG